MAGVSIVPSDNSLILTSAVVSNAGGGAIAAPAATTGKIIRVYKLFLVVTSATSITFQDGSTALSGAMALAANGAITLDFDGVPWFTTSAGAAFNVNSSNAVQVSGTIYYTLTKFTG